MEIFAIRSGLMANNTYILEDGDDVAVIDPARRNKALFAYVEEHPEKKVKYIILTHGHFDHVWDAGKLREKTGAEIAVNQADEAFTENELKNAGTPGKADILLSEGDEIFGLRVMETPGHSEGSICLLTDKEIFSGDTLFKGTVGRTDFEGGDPEKMKKSIARLKALEGDYTVYPGHNEATTLEAERQANPWFREC